MSDVGLKLGAIVVALCKTAVDDPPFLVLEASGLGLIAFGFFCGSRVRVDSWAAGAVARIGGEAIGMSRPVLVHHVDADTEVNVTVEVACSGDVDGVASIRLLFPAWQPLHSPSKDSLRQT